MISRLAFFLAAFVWPQVAGFGAETNANRLAYLDHDDPFHVGVRFPRLATPQWIGEKDVEAVVILAIDDMREPLKYEAFLRPILDRLKQIDGRAPVSIFCNALDPQHPQLQAWLKEGLSLEIHTLSHPCPLLAKGDFNDAENTYHGCIDLLNRIPRNKPVAFRMPCCDSLNSPSPRFYAEVFNRTNSAGQFLTIDSSVMNITTAKDRSLPRNLVIDADGREKFRKYIPFPSFVTTVEDYPYPYVIGKLCWEFPAMAPSDWEAKNLHGTNNPVTVADWKAALDVTVLKQGTFVFIFHPHGWIRPDQLVEFIDFAQKRYGRRVKFLTFREAQERINENLLLGQPLRAADGQDNGVRLIDLNNDAYLDVIISQQGLTRVWDPGRNRWKQTRFPLALVAHTATNGVRSTGARFGVLRPDGLPVLLTRNETTAAAWSFNGQEWIEDKTVLTGLAVDGKPVLTSESGRDRGVRFRDVDNDSRCELIVGNESQNAVFSWSGEEKSWRKLSFSLPEGASIVDVGGRDNGLRFVDVNEDGYDDIIFSNEQRYTVHLFIATPKPHLGWERGWSFTVSSGSRGDTNEIPMIVRAGTNRNNGAWFHSRHMWVQNEDTAHLADKVDRRAFTNLATGAEVPPKSPQESLASIRVRPGFKVELVASEPLVIDPVAFEWGADGKLWVVEMRDYPSGMDGQGKPGGVIKYLEDTDEDGRYDKATPFLEGVKFPTGVMPWRKGVLVSAAPEIFYAEDTDGDGRADLRQPILVGFGEGNQQHRVNGFEYGLDNWVYAANGDSAGTIRSVKTGLTVNLRGHDLRFRPGDGVFVAVAGQTQFGRRRDDWDNWFGNNNPNWLWHYHVPEHYLARNPYLTVRSMRQMLANYPDSTRVFPASRPQKRFNWPAAVNHLTSANSAAPYRDELFGPDFASSVFISEPAHNLVHREILETNGVTFTSRRAADEQNQEFLASTDNWFRPTMLKTGPDGALYVADMYRLVIEHPEYFPDELKKRPDLRAGEDKGRIYRVYPENTVLRRVPRLDQLDPTNLVNALDSPNGWQRDTAGRLLIERGDSSKPVLTQLMIVGANDRNPKVRISVLSTFDGLGALTPNIAFFGLGDYHAAVREFSVRLSEPFLRQSGDHEGKRKLVDALLRLVSDPSLRVRYQLAFTLGEWDDPRAGRALAKLALENRVHESMQTAILSSATRHVAEMLGAILEETASGSPPASLLAHLLDLAAAYQKQNALAQGIDRLARPDQGRFALWQIESLIGFLDALDRRGMTLVKLHDSSGPEVRAGLEKLDALFDWARTVAERSGQASGPASDGDLSSAVRLLAHGPGNVGADLDRLAKLLNPRIDSVIQAEALTRLRRLNDARVAKALMDGWSRFEPDLRTEALNILLSRREWIGELLRAVEARRLPAAEIGLSQRQQLLKHADKAIRERAKRSLTAGNSDRQKLLKEYERVGQLTGDPERGAALYRQNCLTCHRFKGEGNSIGPDLGTVADKPVGTLLAGILDPNQAFESSYINYTAVTRDGREISGIIASETPNSITIRNAGGNDEIILRSDLKDLTSSRLSMMPEGFESTLKPQDMADLIAYLRTN